MHILDKIYPNSAFQHSSETIAIIVHELASDNQEIHQRSNARFLQAAAISHAICSLATPLFCSSILFVGFIDNQWRIRVRDPLFRQATRLSNLD
jgi:hypothetical protein